MHIFATFSQKFCTAVRTGDNSFFFSLLFGAMHEKLFALINLMQKKMSQTKIDGLFQGKKKSIIHKLSPSFWPKKYRRTLKDFLELRSNRGLKNCSVVVGVQYLLK